MGKVASGGELERVEVRASKEVVDKWRAEASSMGLALATWIKLVLNREANRSKADRTELGK